MFDDWIENMRMGNKSENTIKAYSHRVQKFGEWFSRVNGEDLVPSMVTSVDLQEYMGYMLEELNSKPTTANLSLNAIRAWLVFNNRNDIEFPVALKIEKNVPESLSDEDLISFIRTVQRGENERDIELVYSMIYAGLRISEVAALDIEDFHHGKLVIRQGKVREVPVNKTLLVALDKYLGFRLSGPLFTSEKSYDEERLTVNGIGQVIAKYALQARLPNLHPNILRNTFAKNLIEKGYDVSIVAQLLGNEKGLNETNISAMQDLKRAVDSLDS